MEIDRLPLYTVDSPPFPWDEHSASRAALVPNGDCYAFSHETWNAIVNHVYGERYSILKRMGGYFDINTVWDAKYTAYIDTLMNPGDALSAAMFNSVRHNTEMLFGIGWGWAFDRAFRGYVGRKDFRGLASGNADPVYAEYILELVRGMDLVNEVLRGTADMAEFVGQYNIAVPVVSKLLPRKSVPILYDRMSLTDTIGGGVALPSAPISAVKTASSENSGRLKSCLARVLGYGAECVKSGHDAAAVAAVSAPMHFDGIIVSGRCATMDVANALKVAARSESATADDGRGVALPSVPMVCEDVGASAHDAVIVTPEAEPMRGAERVMSANDGTIAVCESVGVAAAGVANTVHFGTYIKALPAYGGAVANIPVANIANIDSAWLPPEWVDGALWIRQVYDEHEIMTASFAPMYGGEISMSEKLGAVVAGESVGVAADDVASTVSSGAVVNATPNGCGAVVQIDAAADAVIDSAWLPPETVDDASWIRQIYDDGEIEVVEWQNSN